MTSQKNKIAANIIVVSLFALKSYVALNVSNMLYLSALISLSGKMGSYILDIMYVKCSFSTILNTLKEVVVLKFEMF